MCVRSLIYLLACGCGDPADEYNVLLVDKDKKSDALTACQDLIKSYGQLRDRMKGTQAFIMPDIRLSSWDFTSEICAEYVQRTGKPAGTLSVVTLSALLNPTGDEKMDEMLRTFYTKDELNVDLDKGFYGHPNIGSAVFAYVQERFLAPSATGMDGSVKINQFMTDLRSEMAKGPAYVYLYGSVFGGTGASVIPNIVEALRTIHGDVPGTNWGQTRLVLGGSLIMPYFCLPQCPENSVEYVAVRPKDDLFQEQTREALLFYDESNMLRHMTNLLLVGTKHLDETSEIYARGADQHQHFHMALQAAGVAGCRFFSNQLPEMNDLADTSGNVSPKGTLLLWKIAPDIDPMGNAKYKTLSAVELGMSDEFEKMNRFFRYSIVIAYYMNAKFDMENELLAREMVVAGTVKQIRDENGRPLRLANERALQPTPADAEKYYKIPVQLAGAFCREFLNYYFDIAMSGYAWSNYHKKLTETVEKDHRTYMQYKVSEEIMENAMDQAKLLTRWCDLVNLPKLQSILSASNASDVVRSTTLEEIMSFNYMDSFDESGNPNRPPCLLNDWKFRHNIGKVYEDDTLKELKLVRGFFGGVSRDDVSFEEVFDRLYTFC